MEDVHVKIKSRSIIEKRHSTRRRIFSPENGLKFKE